MFGGYPQGAPEPKVGEGEEYELRGDTERLYDLMADAKIVNWRIERLEKMGFDTVQASVLAVRRDIDLEDVQRLVSAGAPHEQVVLIVL